MFSEREGLKQKLEQSKAPSHSILNLCFGENLCITPP